MDSKETARIANRVSLITLIINIMLSIGKLIAGILGHSAAMVSDAVHSASDVLSTVVVMIGVTLSSKDADEQHQYGHEKIEAVFSILLAGMLFITALGIGSNGIKEIGNVLSGGEIAVPTLLPLVAALVSIAVKEWMYWYTRAAAKKTKSTALFADAWHHRSDALSSIGSFVGIGGAMLGFPILDPIASLIICLLILKVAYNITRSAIDQLVDRAADEKICEEIRKVVLATKGVIGIDELKTRLFSSKIYVDIDICVDENLTLKQSHCIAENVHDNVEREFPDVKHIMVHVNPEGD